METLTDPSARLGRLRTLASIYLATSHPRDKEALEAALEAEEAYYADRLVVRQ